jgi:CRP-like cAMP-binding protein
MENTIVLGLRRDHIDILCRLHHDFESLARMAVTKVMLQLQQRIVSLQFKNALHKYQNLLISYPDVSLRVPLGYLASYLGITQETLSRIRKQK